MKWFETLQKTEGGSAIDNEPLTWAEEMLNLQQLDRPTALDLSEKIASFTKLNFAADVV